MPWPEEATGAWDRDPVARFVGRWRHPEGGVEAQRGVVEVGHPVQTLADRDEGPAGRLARPDRGASEQADPEGKSRSGASA